MKSDIEIAQEAELVHIKEVAEKLGINEDELELLTRHLPAKERPQQVSDLVRRWLYLVKKRYLHFVSRL